MHSTITANEQEFLTLVKTFCCKIENYTFRLSLDPVEVEELLGENQLVTHVLINSNRFSSCLESFKRYKIDKMRTRYMNLAQSCKNSKRYNNRIGLELGIESPVHALQVN
ncbi:MAG: hypothetical protein JWO06_741 [Bacteroidota bacterium]|nr:hypothetical protein [Bacteroidota bacterium]